MSFSRPAVLVLLSALFAITGDAPVHGQYYPVYGYGNGGIYGRTGGALYGASQVQNAYGNVIVQQEQARIQREVANQAKVDTKRKAFDEMNYKRANTPSYTEEQEKIQTLTVRRIMNQPTQTEVLTGRAANTLLPYLQSLTTTGIQGPPIMLDQKLLAQLNVATGTSKGTNIGPLKNGGKLQWPFLMRGPIQKKIDELLPKAVAQTKTDSLDPQLYLQLTKQVKALDEDWRQKLRKEEVDGSDYINGKHFIESLSSGVNALAQPGAAQLLDGSYAAKGRDVQELVNNMSSEGLTFAPATPGNEAAYYALQNALVSYARAAQPPSSAMQTRLPAPMPAQGGGSYQR
jgi:hypothetical protein